jgi:hypothetical protein
MAAAAAGIDDVLYTPSTGSKPTAAVFVTPRRNVYAAEAEVMFETPHGPLVLLMPLLLLLLLLLY